METDYNLKDIDPGDIDDILVKIEKSFGIEFGKNELVHITTFGQLCDYIADKIQLDCSNDCTSQQAFYKLRNAISLTLQIDSNAISPSSSLAGIFPKQSRRSGIRKLETHLRIKLNILRPPYWVTGILGAMLLISLIGLFINWHIGLLSLSLSVVGLGFAHKFGNELGPETVGQIAEKMTRVYFLKSRRNPETFNKSELEKILIDLFCSDLYLDKSQLTRETKFV